MASYQSEMESKYEQLLEQTQNLALYFKVKLKERDMEFKERISEKEF